MQHRTIQWILGATLVVALLASNVAGVAIEPVAAASPIVQVNTTAGPWVNLIAAQPLQADSVGIASQTAMKPLSLAATGLDADDSADIIAGYATATGGLLMVYPDAGTGTAISVALPVAPDFIATGDLDIDGSQDVIVAAQNGNALWLLRGDGMGGLSAPQAIALPGAITAMAVGEVGRQDGLDDLVTGVVTPAGAQLLIWSSKHGAFGAEAQAFTLDAPAVALALGQLDASDPLDVAIAAGHTLYILHGGDRIAMDEFPTWLASFPLDFEAASLAAGDFVGGDAQNQELALLGTDGQVRVTQSGWQVRDDASRLEFDVLAGLNVTADARLLRTKTSSLATDDLLLINSSGNQVQIYNAGEPGTNAGTIQGQASNPNVLAALDAAAPVVAALPLRLNGDALDDLVILSEGALTPATLLTTSVLTMHIDSWQSDLPDSHPGDGLCKASNGYCTLRAAIQEANASAGADTIWTTLSDDNSVTFALNSPLPAITEAVTLLGSQVDGTYLRITGAALPYSSHGLQLSGNNITVSNVSIINFTGNGIVISGSENVVEDCLIGTNYLGQSGLGNGQNGVVISGSYTQLTNNVIVSNGYSGVRIDNGIQNKVLSGNVIGYWPATGTRLANTRAGVSVYGGSNTVIGGDTLDKKNYIAGNTGSGIVIESAAGIVTVLANNIGVKSNGQLLGNRHGIEVYGSNHTIGSTYSKASWIAGNTWGIALLGPSASYNAVQYNTVSVVSGTANSGDGIVMYNVSGNNEIEYNIIGHNGRHGVYVYQEFPACVRNRIADNYIGTNGSSIDLGNAVDGVLVDGNYCMYLQSNSVFYNGRYGIWLAQNGTDDSTLAMNQCRYNDAAGIRVDSDSNDINDNILTLNPGVGLWVTGNSNTLYANAATGNMIPAATYQITGIQIDGDENTLTGHLTGPTVIAYHTFSGLVINGDGNTVKKYYIHSNGDAGVEISGSSNVIGVVGTDRNTISINDDGVRLTATSSLNQIIGNYIGVETSGTGDAGNGTGMRILGWGNEIESNRIAYAYGSNVVLSGSDAHDNTLQDNNIGPTMASHGISIENAASGNTIQDNQISSSDGAGIYVASGSLNQLLSNTLTLNGSLGIDLAPAGVTLNDSGDNDAGANNLQNFPVLTAVTAQASETRIQGTLNSRPSTSYTVQFFLNTTCDASGYGEAESYLGQTTLSTDSNGQAGFNVTLPVGGATGKYIVATATHTNGDTSELSKCVLGRMPTSGVPIVVNTLSDAADLVPGNGVCDSSATVGEQCTLRAAIQEANALVGADTIILPAGTYPLTVAGIDSTAVAGDLDINESLTLVGAGADVTTVQSQVSDRVFEIRGTAKVTISGLTVKGGSAVDGGGFMVGTSAALTLDAVSVQQNQATSGSGGGIYSSGTLTITSSSVISNTAGNETNGGGGLFLLAGTASLSNATLSGNQSLGNGGGIHNLLATITLNNVTIHNNTADADNDGGNGGGLWTGTSNIFMSNSIIAQNLDLSHAPYRYGVADCYGTLTTPTYNLIGDKAQEYNSPNPPACVLSGGTNNSVGGFWFMTNYLTYSAGLGSLRMNGGTTLNHMPVSAASGVTVDRANPATPGSSASACLAFDQRGQPRPIDGGTDGVAVCDRGAVEHVPSYLSLNDVTVTEGNPAQFTVSLSEPAQITFTVQYSTTGITAFSDADYIHTAGTLTFSPGQTSKTVSVTTRTDTYDEDVETFRLRLFDPQYVFIADGEGIGSITDGSPTPSIMISDSSALEGDAGDAAQLTLTLTLNSASGKTVTVNYTTVDGTAVTGLDYLAQSGQVSFAPGETTRSLTFTLIGDDLDENNETFTVQLSAPVNASLGDASGQATILDDDALELTISDSAIFEGDSGTSPIYFTVRLSNPSTQQITVNYSTSPGTAVAVSDYIHTSGTLTFAPGDTLKTISVSIVGDLLPESDEIFYVSLSNPTSTVTIARVTATGAIWEGNANAVYLPMSLHNTN